jgi:polyhydroxybutyrate depolymerase
VILIKLLLCTILSLLFSVSLLTRCPTALTAPAQDYTLTIMVGGQLRSAFLHLPADLELAGKYPLVIGYHCGAGNAQGYIEQSQLFTKGERAGFIVVSPQGTLILRSGNHRVWNSGHEYEAATKNANDVTFTRMLIEKITSEYPVDQKRVYATGFSNGAQMSYRLALELSEAIAAIAPMSGGRLAADLRPRRPVPLLHLHGTDDGFYQGGLGVFRLRVDLYFLDTLRLDAPITLPRDT